MNVKNPHPSGRPIHTTKKVERRKWNIPDDEYQTPRLQKKHCKEAIGFGHSFPADDFYYDQEA